MSEKSELVHGIKGNISHNAIYWSSMALSGLAFTMSVTGTGQSLIEYCFIPQKLRDRRADFCQPNQRYVMPESEYVAEEHAPSNPEFSRERITLPEKATRLRHIPATNPNKHLWALFGLAAASVALLVSKGREMLLVEKLPELQQTIRGTWAITKAVEIIRCRLAIAKEAVSAAAEFELHKEHVWADARATQWANLSPAQRQVLLREERKQREAKAAAQAALEAGAALKEVDQQHRRENVPKLEGTDTLESVTSPKNKVSAAQLSAQERLSALLHAHEGGWLEVAIGGKGLHIYGSQGSAKTTFAAFLALAAYVIHDRVPMTIADPHYHQNGNDPRKWLHFRKIGTLTFGAHGDYSQIAKAIEATCQRFDTRTEKHKPVSSIFDELTNYEKYDESRDAAAILGRRRISDPRKANEVVITIGHGKTLKTMGGADGTKDATDENVLYIKLNADNFQRPLFRGQIFGLKDSNGEVLADVPITLNPQWMNPDFVWGLIDEERKAQKENVPGNDGMPDIPKNLLIKAIEQLEKTWNILPSDKDNKTSKELPIKLSENAQKLFAALSNLHQRSNGEWIKIWKAGSNCNLRKDEYEAAVSELKIATLIETNDQGEARVRHDTR